MATVASDNTNVLHFAEAALKEFAPQKAFFVGIDSDGCVFDSMEIKHKECFCPNFIKHMKLQSVSKFAREAWDFVNLYSRHRGCNRFIALCLAIDLLKDHEEVKMRKVLFSDMSVLKKWTDQETKLGNPALKAFIEKNDSPILKQALAWSLELNKDIEEMVYGITPFSYVPESLAKVQQTADIMVVSQTPIEAITREWKENNIEHYIRFIAGQEYGSKKQHIALGAKGKYDDDKILMIGDAPGDYRAAADNGVHFFPIIPGCEDDSWKLFYTEALDKFFAGTYAGSYENGLVDQFFESLPEEPNWK